MKFVIIFIALFSFGIAFGEEIKVAISPFAPFCIIDGENVEGYSVDIMNEVAKRSGIKLDYKICTGVKDKLSNIRSNSVNMAIGGITVTNKREKEFDFSHSTYKSGLDIMVSTSGDISLWESARSLWSGPSGRISKYFFLLVLISAILIWFFERGRDNFNDKWYIGIPEGLYFSIVTASTVGFGDKTPANIKGRILTCIIIIVSLPLFGMFTAELSSTFTLQSLQSSIQGPESITGMKIAVIDSTTGESWIKSTRAKSVKFNNFSNATKAVQNGSVDGFVYDSPAIAYCVKDNNDLMAVNRPFMEQDFGFAFPSGSPLVETVNQCLLELQEEGFIENVKKKWF